MKNTLYALVLFVLVGNICALDTYISYDPLLRMRVGVNHKRIGIYLRPVIDRINGYENRGSTLGFNLNEKLFAHRQMECILNVFTGFGLLDTKATSSNTPVEKFSFWKREFEFGLIPELRFYKRASVTISPVLYRYTWTKDSYARDIEFSEFNVQTISFNNLTIGFKFYYLL